MGGPSVGGHSGGDGKGAGMSAPRNWVLRRAAGAVLLAVIGRREVMKRCCKRSRAEGVR